ncbi:15.4 kDa class V heat shock protein [Telopea speciosissima]|uniref:15.4 kDa class V heat shock protein n=1 Tax=Telopea speciosissima TaxID=54955 RepID=UPI001CC40D83|nr:15.4 kDa class V heat shock protein [Telopea speciosissima]
MEFSNFQSSPWHFFFSAPLLFPSYFTQENYVHWTETPESHIYSADLPGVKKEEIRVEVEDSIYLIIRTQAVDGEAEPARSFMRKFKLPGMIDVNGISAGYEDGVLRVTVPRSFVNRRVRIDPANLPERYEVLAPAA